MGGGGKPRRLLSAESLISSEPNNAANERKASRLTSALCVLLFCCVHRGGSKQRATANISFINGERSEENIRRASDHTLFFSAQQKKKTHDRGHKRFFSCIFFIFPPLSLITQRKLLPLFFLFIFFVRYFPHSCQQTGFQPSL